MLLVLYTTSEAQVNSFNDCLASFEDTASPKQVIQQLHLNTLTFQKKANRRIDIGIVKNDYYYFVLKLNANGASVKNQLLSIDNTSLDDVQIYTLSADGGSTLLYQGGNNMPYDKNRNYAWHTAPLDIGTNTSYYLIAVKSAYKNVNFRYDIIEPDAFVKRYETYQHYVFFYMGFISMIALTMLIAFVLFKQSVFGAYLGYTICAGGWILSHYGCFFSCCIQIIPNSTRSLNPLPVWAPACF